MPKRTIPLQFPSNSFFFFRCLNIPQILIARGKKKSDNPLSYFFLERELYINSENKFNTQTSNPNSHKKGQNIFINNFGERKKERERKKKGRLVVWCPQLQRSKLFQFLRGGCGWWLILNSPALPWQQKRNTTAGDGRKKREKRGSEPWRRVMLPPSSPTPTQIQIVNSWKPSMKLDGISSGRIL